MLIEVPKGTTKLQIRFDTPALFSTQSMVMGRVAAEELVEKAVTSAGAIALKWRIGLTLAINFRKRGRPINMKTASPATTVRKKRLTDKREVRPVAIKTFATRQKTPNERNFMMI